MSKMFQRARPGPLAPRGRILFYTNEPHSQIWFESSIQTTTLRDRSAQTCHAL
ncbi:Hypothetical protein SMAX5B_000868, partial [Scophthalmus maximus]